MHEKPQFPQGLPIEQVMRLASTPRGQALLDQLQNTQNPQLSSAVHQAQSGNYQQLQETLSDFLRSPAGKELIRQLRG